MPSAPRCAALLLASLPAAAPAEASGFALAEQGARAVGFAGAFTAQAVDPTAIFYNPAGIGFLTRKQVSVGGSLVRPSLDFAGSEPFPGPRVAHESDPFSVAVPAVSYAQPFSERLVMGVGVHSPFAQRTRWRDPETFSGRFLGHQAEIRAYSVSPTLAVKLADRLALGAALDLRLSTVSLERRAAIYDPFRDRFVDAADVRLSSDTDLAASFAVGLLGRPTPGTSVGLTYRHGVRATYEGEAVFTPLPTGSSQLDVLVARSVPALPVPAEAALEFPASLTAGLAYTWNDWTGAVDLAWYGWSAFDRIDVALEGRAPEVIEEGWEDSLAVRAGVERALGTDFALRGGYFYEQTPAPAETLSPLLADADRHGIALGGSWTDGRLRVDAGAWLVLAGARATGGSNVHRYEGTYDPSSLTLALAVGYAF